MPKEELNTSDSVQAIDGAVDAGPPSTDADLGVNFYGLFDQGGDFAIKELMFPDGSARSQQLSDTDAKARFGKTLFEEILYPDYDPTYWAKTPEMNTRVRTSCRIVAQNVAGLRWILSPTINEATMAGEQMEEFERQQALVMNLLGRPNPKWPLSTLLYRCWYDRKATGKGHVEVTRDVVSEIDGLYHAQSKDIYPLKRDTPSWIQKKHISGGSTAGSTTGSARKKYFKEFGDTLVVNAETGKIHDGAKDGALDVSLRATELFTFIEYSSDLEKVGAPPHASAAMAVSGNWYSAQRNRNTQITDAMPRAIITVSGGTLTSESEKSIHRFLNAGARNTDDMRSNRVMVLSVQKAGPAANVSPEIKVIPLTIASGEDATFQKYRDANNEEIREAFGLAALFYGSTEGTNRASAAVARHITIEQAFKPETEELEYVINNSIIFDVLKSHGIDEKDIIVQFKMIRPPAADEIEQSQLISRYIQGGAFSPNDIRRYLNTQGFNLALWEGAWAELPLFITLGILKLRVEPDDLGLPGDFEEDGEEPPEDDDDESKEQEAAAQVMRHHMPSLVKDLGIFGLGIQKPSS